mmetsp:Transcript_13564/g.19868  ORF Transcript_13564/g.19868 Transcript_13564/m.19868 type:complete len:468 (+) Transcript_13564:101-1504(+)
MWKSKHRIGGGAEGRISSVVEQERQRKGKRCRQNSIIKSNSSPACPVAPPVCPVVSNDLTFDAPPQCYDKDTLPPKQIQPVIVEQETTSDESDSVDSSFLSASSDYDDDSDSFASNDDDDYDDYNDSLDPSKLPSSSSNPSHTRDECDYFYMSTLTPSRKRTKVSAHHISDAKTTLLHALAAAGGDVTSARFSSCLDTLTKLYHSSHWDARRRDADNTSAIVANTSRQLEGMWLTLSKPNYPDCLGRNEGGDYMYTLGRMSFDIFRPTNLLCSIQGMFNPVNFVPPADRGVVDHVPRALREEVAQGDSDLRTYNIVTAFTIEPCKSKGEHGPIRPIRGLLTTFGYNLPDPDVPNRFSIWFTGGTIEVNDPVNDGEEWKRIFGGKDVPRRHLTEEARVLAAKILMGAAVPTEMEEDGTMRYQFHRPIGGHGSHYVDVLYLDDTLRIMKGHRGTVYVFSRVPTFPAAMG